jgi:aldose 1-epimerase
MPTTDLIELECADVQLALCPRIGGCVASLRHAGVDVLRPGSAEALRAGDPLGLGAFPLFPFSGRVDQGRFRFAGRDVALTPNFPPEPHAIHGQAWRNAWQVEAASDTAATLTYTHAGDDWPWRYRAEQYFSLDERGLELTLSLTNLDTTPMPAGKGWHPYFPRRDARLSADVTAVWLSGEDMIPEAPADLDEETDLRSMRPVAELHVDNAFDAENGACSIEWPGKGLTVRLGSSTEFGHLVVYTPDEADFFCVEPVSHAPNALNSALPAALTGQRVLEPGSRLDAHLSLRIEAS